jgi:gliding motility-associated-like protein
VITVTPSLPTTNRHEIIPASNPSQLDPYGLFPINPPDGSGYCVKLGNDINGRGAERISYQINVPANSSDASITYRYAVVFQDPGHLTYEQPRFSAKLLDVLTNTYLPCATYEYISTSSIPGFNSSPVNDTVKYKTWASVYVNLSKYAGRTLILEFTTADCTRGAHWGYAYVDVGDCNIAASVDYRCNPNQATFTAPPGFEFYNWWSSDFSTLYGTGEKMIMNSPPVPGTTIHVEVIPYNGFGCSDTLDVPYTVNFPVADAGPDKAICGGIATTIGSNAISGTSYSWSPATNLSNPNSAFPIANPSATTTYIVTATSSSTGCFTKDTVTININPKPAPVFSTTPSQCFQDNRFSFSNTSSINQGSMTYFWDFADNSTAIVANPIHSYTSTGTFNVKLIATSNSGCKDSAFQEVKVNPHPNVAAGDDLAICRGSSTQLQVSGAQTYEWLLPAQNLSCTDCASPFASPVNNSTYIVKGTDVNGCPGYDTINIVVHQPIQIAVSPGRTICDGDSVAITLQVTGSAASYAWTPAQSLNNSAIKNPVASPHTTTQYRVIGYDGHNCFSDTGYINIKVNPTPKIDLGPDLVLPTGTVYPLKSLIQNGPIINWHWSPATDLNCTTCPEPSATVKNNIIYYTTVTNIHNCIASDSVRIRAFCEGSQVFIPNAFTPDGDGRNDILMVRANGIQSVRSFRIYSRWGELVFEKNNFPPNLSSYGWDGKIKGVTGPAEVYVYIAEVICENLQTYVIKGNTTILK